MGKPKIELTLEIFYSGKDENEKTIECASHYVFDCDGDISGAYKQARESLSHLKNLRLGAIF